MKAITKLLIFVMLPLFATAQNTSPEKLKDSLKAAQTDSLRVELLAKLDTYYSESNREVSLKYLEQCIELDKKNGKMVNLAGDLDSKGYQLTHQQKFAEAFNCFQEAKKLAEDAANENSFWHSRNNAPKGKNLRLATLASIHHDLGHLMGATGDIEQQIAEYRQTIAISNKAGATNLIGLANMNLAHIYIGRGKLDSALLSLKKAAAIFEQSGFKTYLGYVYEGIGSVYNKKGDHRLALLNYRKSEISSITQNNLAALGVVDHMLSEYYLALKDADSSVFYAKKTLTVMRSAGYKDKSIGYETLYKSYRLNHQPDSVTKYLELALAAKDSSFNAMVKNLADFQKSSFKTQTRLNDLEKEKELTRSRNRTYFLLSTIVFLVIIALIFYRNNRQKQKANHLLTDQKEEIQTQRDQLGNTIEQLKASQTRLIQSEKMASLGELTAGIAHEIQNPLNFVNNFSEVSAELVDEMDEELNKGDIAEAKAIGADLKQNLEKIRHHGKRADSIVKGMLEHSKAGTGVKEKTDINALADEYLRLSYHGLRAKDKDFNADLMTNFDSGLPKANVVPQDISRVLLNLFNNAFYAVKQKAKMAGADYKAEVTVTTALEDGHVIIKVKDNGVGIPDEIKEKIMQPFFTTKPTGEGTGLGLSLSYDIVVKGHGGNIMVESKASEGSLFTINLPIA